MPAKFRRCVKKVKASGSVVNPYAVCRVSTGYYGSTHHSRLHNVMHKDRSQLQQGVDVEMEHAGLIAWAKKYRDKHKECPTDRMIAKKIAQTHLREDKQYYTKLKKAKL